MEGNGVGAIPYGEGLIGEAGYFGYFVDKGLLQERGLEVWMQFERDLVMRPIDGQCGEYPIVDGEKALLIQNRFDLSEYLSRTQRAGDLSGAVDDPFAIKGRIFCGKRKEISI